MAANDNYLEGLTIRNTDLAFLAGLKHIAGARGITIKKCRIENVGRAFTRTGPRPRISISRITSLSAASTRIT